MKKAIIIAIVFLISVYQAKSEKITVDSKGNMYVLGDVQLSITFSDSTTIVANMYPYEQPKTYLVKLDPGGSVVWYKLFEQIDENYFDIQTDKADNLVLACQLMGRIALDSATVLEGTFQFLMVKFNPDGDLLWYNLSSGKSNGYGVSIAIDALDNIYTSSLFKGNFHFNGPDTLADSYPAYRPFVAKFDSSGYNSWLQNLDSWEFNVYDLDVDYSGNIVMVGSFKHSIVIQGDTLDAGDSGEGYWMKFDTHGNLLKVKQIEGAGISEVGAGKNGHFSYLGFFRGDTLFIDDFAPTPNTSSQAGNFVAHVDQEDTESWLLNFNGSDFSHRYGIEMDNANNTYLYTLQEEGSYYDTLLNSFVGADISKSNYLIKIDSLGNPHCFLKINSGQITDAAILESGPIYIVGRFENELRLNGATYMQQGNNIFIARFDLNCNTTWTSLVSNPVTAVDELSTTGHGISIFPNPATNQTSLSFNDHASKSGKIILYTMDGTKKLELEFSEKELIGLDIEKLSPGIYIALVITNDHKRANFKIVKI